MVALTLDATFDDEAQAVGAGSGVNLVEFGIEHVLPSVVAETWYDGTPSDEDDYTAQWTYALTGLSAGAQIKVRARCTDVDGNTATEAAQITVNVPQFTSTPGTSVETGAAFSYSVTATDPGSETLTITAPTKPAWLSITTVGGGAETLSGTAPGSSENAAVVLRVTNATSSIYVEQSFTIRVGSDALGLITPKSRSLARNASRGLAG